MRDVLVYGGAALIAYYVYTQVMAPMAAMVHNATAVPGMPGPVGYQGLRGGR